MLKSTVIKLFFGIVSLSFISCGLFLSVAILMYATKEQDYNARYVLFFTVSLIIWGIYILIKPFKKQ
jgi:hypothetical protein